jgi:hypothetical protein
MRGAAVAIALAAAGLATGETVYKCQAGGRTIYQQTPCAKDQRQQAIHLEDPAPSAAPPAPSPVTPVAGERAEAAPPPQAFAPPPTLFGCIRATDGKPYTSRDGQPQPYMAPLGVLGVVSQPLADTYGSRGAAVASAPELNRGKGNAAAVATSNYVWVQDQCRPLSPAEACAALRDDAEANQRAIRNAFKSERGPLEAKDAQLRQQLQGCNRS